MRLHPFRRLRSWFAILLTSCIVFAAHAQSMPPFPVEGRILFNRWAYEFLPQDAYNRLWRIDADGTDVRAMVPALPDRRDIDPAWSQDGKWVAYIHVSNTFGSNRNLFVEDASATPVSRHRLTPTSGNYAAPSWSPDGQWIAYNDLNAFCVRIVRPDGSERRTLWCLAGGGFFFPNPPVWSSDSRIVTVPSGVLGEDLLRYEAWRIDVNTLAATRVLAEDDIFGPWMWISPDGRKALFAYDRPTGAGDILLIDIATRARTDLGPGHNPLFSRDSRKLAFSRTDYPQVVGDPESTHVYVTNIDGTQRRRLTFSQIDQLRYTAADWSRDGNQVLVNRVITIPTNIPALPYGRLSAQMRIFDLPSRLNWTIPVVGTAGQYGWYQGF